MKEFLVLLREKGGRISIHDEAFMEAHREKWNKWLSSIMSRGLLKGGQALTLQGRIIQPDGEVISGIRHHNHEIVGGYLIIKAKDLDEVAEIMKSCPVYETGGFAEIREPKSA